MKKLHFILLFSVCTTIFSCKKNNATPGGSDGGNVDSDITVTILNPVAVTKTNSQKVYVHYMPWFEDKSTSPDGKWGMH